MSVAKSVLASKLPIFEELQARYAEKHPDLPGAANVELKSVKEAMANEVMADSIADCYADIITEVPLKQFEGASREQLKSYMRYMLQAAEDLAPWNPILFKDGKCVGMLLALPARGRSEKAEAIFETLPKSCQDHWKGCVALEEFTIKENQHIDYHKILRIVYIGVHPSCRKLRLFDLVYGACLASGLTKGYTHTWTFTLNPTMLARGFKSSMGSNWFSYMAYTYVFEPAMPDFTKMPLWLLNSMINAGQAVSKGPFKKHFFRAFHWPGVGNAVIGMMAMDSALPLAKKGKPEAQQQESKL